MQCDDGEIELNTSRNREGGFEPQLIKKNKTCITQMGSQILSLYAKGITTCEIVATFQDMFDADVSPRQDSNSKKSTEIVMSRWF